MEPLTLTLLGYPLSILASFTFDQLKKLSQKIEDINPLKDLFLKAFFTSLDYHDKYYDDYSKEVIGKLRKAVKKDEDKLLIIFSKHSDNFDNFLSLVKSREFQKKIAEEIIDEYSFDFTKDQELMGSIISDCLSYYRSAFFNQMNEKEGIRAILIECLKIDTVVDLLNRIDSQVVTKNDFDELRRIVLLNYYNENREAQKELEDYDQYLRNKYKHIELRGFSPKISGKEVQMELLDIFVPLEMNIDTSIVPNIMEEKMPLLQRAREIGNSESKEDKKKDPITSISEYRYLVILGDPGSGKSTLMKYLAVKVIKSRNTGDLFANIIPLYIRISDYADYYKKDKKTLYEFITEYYDKQYQHIFKEGFECSNLLLLMDGLDEITDTPLRIRVTEQVMDLIARYPYNLYVVTSRIVGYQESKLGGEFRHFKLMPFGLDEIKMFSEQWYKSIALHTDKDYNHAEEQAGSLYSSISRSSSVLRLATNPLLMTIIAMIHYKGKKLPSKRVELYDVSTETFLEYWVQLRMDDASRLKDKNEIIEILAPIAFEIHQNRSNALIEEKEFEHSFLENLKNIHTNTLDEDAKREFKEFKNFLRQQAGFFYKWDEGGLDLKDYVFNPRWTEIIRLAAAQLRLSYKGRTGRKQSTQFVKDILLVEDPFPEAYRPLQLVCLILSDDVNIMDELLNEILDKIIEVASKTDFAELIKSFSKLFKEILYSDYRNGFIDRFEKEMIAGNLTLLNNLLYCLVSNSEDSAINDVLISLCNENEEILKAIYRIDGDFPFQNTKVYKENFKNYLSCLKSQNDDEELEKALNNFMQMQSSFFFLELKLGGITIEEGISSKLDQFFDTPVFDILLAYVFKNVFEDYLIAGNRSVFDTLSQRYSDTVLVKNLNKSLNKMNFNDINLSHHKTIFFIFGVPISSVFKLKNHTVLLIKQEGMDLQLWCWTQSFDELFYHPLSFTNISSTLESLKQKFSESDIETIEWQIYSIFGPQEGADTENTTRLIKAYEGGMFEEGMRYDFSGWKAFSLINITSNPSILSKVIIQYGQRHSYMRREEGIKGRILYMGREEVMKGRINLKDFDNEHIRSPAKLLAYHLLNEPFDQKLLEESIEYFRGCSSEEKKGAFSILYTLLNPFELTYRIYSDLAWP
jgi:energy-coupling factor transporter ATP-binding protein EcfA2